MRCAEQVAGSTVVELTDPRWSGFVAQRPEANPFHHPHWARLVAGSYGFRAFALVVIGSPGTVRSGLPLVEVRHLHGPAKWVSLPFTDYCPPLAPDQHEEDQLVSALRRMSAAAGVQRVEIRARLAGAPPMGAPALRHVLSLNGGAARVYSGFHKSQVQRSIRRAEREGLTVRHGECEEDVVRTFYGLHLRTRRRQGVPVQPRRFFRLLWEGVIRTGLGSVLIVEAAGRPAAAAVFLAWNGTVVYKFGASDPSAWPLRPNHLLFWHAIRAACERGDQWFDFGRTDAGQQGLRNFKRSWGAAEEPLVYGALGNRPHRVSSVRDRMAAAALESAIQHGPPLLCRVAGEMLYRYSA